MNSVYLGEEKIIKKVSFLNELGTKRTSNSVKFKCRVSLDSYTRDGPPQRSFIIKGTS